MKVIRGAICAQNTAESISENALLQVSSILKRNNLSADSVSAVFFSATADLDACYPATAVRRQLLPEASFMCFRVMDVKNSLPNCLRVAVFADVQTAVHCYIGEAKKLRPDIDG